MSWSMALPPLPPMPLIVLRSIATLQICAVIDQAGWAAAFLGGAGQFRSNHRIGAVVTLLVCWLGALAYLLLRRWAGAVNVALALLLAVGVSVQYWLGTSHVVAPHVFIGVLLAMVATALTSWTFRHPGPDRSAITPAP